MRPSSLLCLGLLLACRATLASEPAAPPAVRFELFAKVEERPVLVTHAGQPGRVFIVEQPGRIVLVDHGKQLETPYLDIAAKLVSQGECGLLGLAFHTNFAKNGLFYVNYTADRPGATPREVRQGNKTVKQMPLSSFIAEFHADPSANTADPATQRILMTIDQPYENHNGGMIAFGPDGMLYICMGDGGNQRDPHNNGQNLNTHLAKMLRIDVDHRDGARPYAIPKDNPLVGRDNVKPEIFAWGLRNSWRFSFDRETGLLYAADVGEDRWEEINLVVKGGNYGWSVREGRYPFDRIPPRKDELPRTDPPDHHPGFVDPIKTYWHSEGLSITGGYVYRGRAIPALRGWYLYGDYSKGTVWGLKYENNQTTGDGVLRIANDKEIRPMLPSGFGEDADGEVYVCSHQDGKIWKIVPER